MIAALALLATLAAGSATAADPCAALNARIDRTYGFRLSALDEAALQKKNEELDAVWSAVHHDRALVPCLKAALQRRTEDAFFQMDGSQLLVEVDPSHESKERLLAALRRVPLEDVDLRTWVSLGSSLGVDGFDTSELGKRWLAFPKAEYYLIEHGAYRVDRENGAMFLFGALDERFATPTLVALSRSSSGEAKDIAVELLMSQATPQALDALAKIGAEGLSPKIAASRKALLEGPALIEPRPHPQTSREQFLRAFSAFLAGDEQPFARLVEAVPDGERDLVAVAKPEDVEVIRKVRRRFIAKNTQHAIEFYNQFTQILMTLVWKGEPGRK